MSMREKSSYFLMTLVLTSALPASAAEWKYEPFVRATARYDDNIRFVSSQEESSAGAIVDVGVSMVNESERTVTVFQPRLSSSGYSSEGDLNTNDQFVDFSTRLTGERSNLGFGFGYARDSAITSELEDTGTVTVNTRRNRFSVTPRWEYRFSPINSVQIGYNFRSVEWANEDNPGLLDNDINEVWSTYKRRLSEHDDLSLRLFQTDFESPDAGFDSTTSGAEIGFIRRFTELNRIEVGIGGWNADLNSSLGKESNSGTSLTGALVHTDETTYYKIELSQSVVPSSAGQIRQDRRLRAFADFKFSPRLKWGVDALFLQAEKLGDLSTESDRDYYAVRPFLAWDWTSKIRLESSLRFSNQDFKDTGITSDRSEILLSLQYGKSHIAY